jgi:hypothetical protein
MQATRKGHDFVGLWSLHRRNLNVASEGSFRAPRSRLPEIQQLVADGGRGLTGLLERGWTGSVL